MVDEAGFEPAQSAIEADALPMSYSCERRGRSAPVADEGVEPSELVGTWMISLAGERSHAGIHSL